MTAGDVITEAQAPPPPAGGGGAPPRRPHVVFVVNELSPYRVHKLRRFADEIPEMEMSTLVTHEAGSSGWVVRPPPQLGCVMVGEGRDAYKQFQLAETRADWKKGGRIIQWIKDRRAAAVVSFGYGDLGHLRVLRWCDAHGVPLAMWGDSNVLGDRATGLRGLVKRFTVRRVVRWCDALLPCGSLGRAYYEKYGAEPGKMFYMPNEPDYARVGEITAEQVRAAANRYGLSPDRKRLVYSGRLVRDKRVDLLVDAFASVAARRPEWDLLVIGGGPLEAELRARVPAALAGRVTFAGFVDGQDTVTALYKGCDVLVLPSEWEPWALVVNEAAACGLAVVASSVVGAAAELVRDGVNGYIFPSGDIAALRARLLDVTEAQTLARMKVASPGVLADWRRVADPVQGLRRALEFMGVLPARAGAS